MSGVVTAGIFMAALGLCLGVILAVANKKLHVYEDPRIDVVEDMLPNANCGACGTPGCHAFAEGTVKGELSPGQCPVNSAEKTDAIADYLGVSAGGGEKRVARLACAGGAHVARTRVMYEGLSSCRGAALVGGGGKGCAWGCLGLGDCDVVCSFGAITMNAYGLPEVDIDKCTSCGDCVEVCPKDLFSIQPVEHKLWVACKSQAKGDDALEECNVACTACGRCAADAPAALVTMQDNLPRIDYSKNQQATLAIIQRCPTGAIVWSDARGGVIKGADAKRVARKTPLPVG
jgi:Na+-translocating ferredoxin:NAD+ oxidoreductase RNF subunit RnfB